MKQFDNAHCKPLTAKQTEAVSLMCDGGTTKSIMVALNLSKSAVKGRIDKAIERYGAENRVQLAFLVGREKGREAVVFEAKEKLTHYHDVAEFYKSDLDGEGVKS